MVLVADLISNYLSIILIGKYTLMYILIHSWGKYQFCFRIPMEPMKNGLGRRTVEQHIFEVLVEIYWANRNRNSPELCQGSICMSVHLPKTFKAVPF